MPIYEYVCTACDHRTDILHGINDPAPHFCPSCGRDGTMRKLFAPPVIHYKGSGWAKKDRGSAGTKSSTGSSTSSSASSSDLAGSKGSSGSDGGSSGTTGPSSSEE